ncbi:TIGR03088 family PEP-CTERM/XrtA system glycosyltransferase [Massilia atriviolacea]|uniref:TIGR03088 family PEP-CTERM/XrtA system glycosyltransferase n=1 Tax=Massilia atriviolacea TaxID=2495579 RepID=A0A430HTV7_9BURK|nr:TIGR03088 family PEP-CTERM/XrtA system glycosyltransferase [Massilia atriviolacea]RSZ60814.1 TIGR03088 family PEP-CTERM/XrtA system glycosyltransferase [Massilia atriviolacea]
MTTSLEPPRLVVHLIHQLDVGGLENGLINLIKHMPPERYRHAIVCLKDYSDYHAHIKTRGVEIISLNKREGKDWGHYLRLFRALRTLQPDLIHTRNLCGIEGQLVAALAGVKLRVHGEHGRDMSDLYGKRLKYKLLRRLLRPLIGHFIAVSADLEHWLIDSVGAEPEKVSHISNGVDSIQFHPRLGPPAAVGPAGFMQDNAFVIGSVGRMEEIKDYGTLVEAFLRLIASPHPAHQRMRLLIVGDGPQRAACMETLTRAGAAHRAWLPGERSDIAQLLRAMDVFVLPSLAEGSSNTILEAMATGLPVVATAVGGNPVLVHPGFTGILVPPRAPDLMAAAIADYCRIPDMAARHGMRARSQVIANHSLPEMARGYLRVYDALAHPDGGCPGPSAHP